MACPQTQTQKSLTWRLYTLKHPNLKSYTGSKLALPSLFFSLQGLNAHRNPCSASNVAIVSVIVLPALFHGLSDKQRFVVCRPCSVPCLPRSNATACEWEGSTGLRAGTNL